MSHTPDPKRYRAMTYDHCGKSGLKLPAISLGLWNNFGAGASLENARAMCRRAFDFGITHFDLANNSWPPSGSAEITFGKILQTDFSGLRDELVISSKAGYLMGEGPYSEWGSRKHLTASLDQSLKRMGIDYVDIFYSHRFDPATPLDETMAHWTRRCVPAKPSMWASLPTTPNAPRKPIPRSRSLVIVASSTNPVIRC